MDRNIHTYPFGLCANQEIHKNQLVYIHSKWMDFLDFRKMQGAALYMAARPAGRPPLSTPSPLSPRPSGPSSGQARKRDQSHGIPGSRIQTETLPEEPLSSDGVEIPKDFSDR